MKLRPWSFKLMLNIFPPLFFNRIIVKNISPDFLRAEVKARRSLLNKNLNRSIFGGTIFSAADPFYSTMYWQALLHRGIKCESWLKGAEISYLKPAMSHLRLVFELSPEEIDHAQKEIAATGKFEKWHTVYARDKQQQICAEIRTLVYIRALSEN